MRPTSAHLHATFPEKQHRLAEGCELFCRHIFEKKKPWPGHSQALDLIYWHHCEDLLRTTVVCVFSHTSFWDSFSSLEDSCFVSVFVFILFFVTMQVISVGIDLL